MSLTEIRSEMSRRSTRMFVEEQELVDRSNITMSASSRESSVDDNEKAAHQSKSKSTIAGGDISQQAMVNVGRSLDIFPITSEDINLHSKFSHLSRPLSCYSCLPFTQSRNFYGSCSVNSTLSISKHTAILRAPLLIFKQSPRVSKLPESPPRQKKTAARSISALLFPARYTGAAGQWSKTSSTWEHSN